MHQMEHEGFLSKKDEVVYIGEESVAGATITRMSITEDQKYELIADMIPLNGGKKTIYPQRSKYIARVSQKHIHR